MRYLIGVGLIILGGVLTGVTGFPGFIPLVFIGVFLFASLVTKDSFCDYVIAYTSIALVRKRYYLIFLPFFIISMVLTFGKAILLIPFKEEYFKVKVGDDDTAEPIQISRREYIAMRNEQRNYYSTQLMSREFMEKTYSKEGIRLKRKRNRLIAAIIFLSLSLLMLVEPGGIYLILVYAPIFLGMVICWIPDYRDAKILQQAYDRAMAGGTPPQNINQ